MAAVTVYSKEHIDGMIDLTVVGAAITGGNLVLTLGDGSTVNVGAVVSGLPDATTDTKGVVELALDTETITGTDGVRAVTPLGLAALTATATRKGLVELSTDAENVTGTDTTRAVTPAGMKNFAQPIDADLTAIAALTATTNNFLQSSGSAWASRTPTQAAATLGAVGMPVVSYSTGSGYAIVTTPAIYVGPTDPGAVANGSIWYDTTGA